MNDKPTIAVIGTGIMGAGITRNFLKHQYEVHVWNRNAERTEPLVEAGAIAADTPKSAVEQADIVFEVTANDESSAAVWGGDDGILAGIQAGKTVITCATLSAEWTDKLAVQCSLAGLYFFDMPMTGGRQGAETGNLVLLAGGTARRLDALRPTLKAIAAEVRHFGPAGFGMRYKLILNSLQAVIIGGFGEAMRLAREAGLDEKLAGEALADRPGGTTIQLTQRDYPYGPQPINFAVDWIAKDINYAKQMAGDLELPLIEEALREYQAKIDAGEGQSDWTSIALPE